MTTYEHLPKRNWFDFELGWLDSNQRKGRTPDGVKVRCLTTWRHPIIALRSANRASIYLPHLLSEEDKYYLPLQTHLCLLTTNSLAEVVFILRYVIRHNLLLVHPEGVEPSRTLILGINQCTLITLWYADYALVKSRASTYSAMGASCGEVVQGYLERQPALLVSLSIVIPVLICLHHQPGKKEMHSY